MLSSHRVGCAATVILAMAAGPLRAEDASFESLARDYVEELLAMNPELATALGDHRYDHRLNDYTLDGVRANLERERTFRARLAEIDGTALSPVNAIDREILGARIEAQIFSLETLREHEWNPLHYNVGGAIYALLERDFAPLGERLRNAARRLEELPAVLQAARANLRNPPRVHTETAIQQNGGTLALIRDELPRFIAEAREPSLASAIAPARAAAVAALEAYGEWLEAELLPRSDGDFRLGEDKFRAKLVHTLGSELPMEDILARAEQSLAETQAAMYRAALPLFDRHFPAAAAVERENRAGVVRAVLDRLAEARPSNDTVVEQARTALDEATRFVRERRLVTVPDEPIRVIVMPEFQRGVAVAYCDPPGPLEQNGTTFYSLSPTPADWSPERVESFYREYNDYMLMDLTVHEAMPGHYLQLAHANRFEAPTMIRAIFWSGPFVEGWALYAEELMAEHGFGGPEVRLQQLKMRLRAIINAILDQKIHAAGMTEQEAMDLMMTQGFQEEGEAAGKWRRAQLTSTQLSTYFVGYSEVADIRRAHEARNGPIADWQAFHDRLLSFGSPPARYVRRMLEL